MVFWVALVAYLPSIFVVYSPGDPFSTTNPCTLLPSSALRAHTVIKSAKVAFPIHLFSPFTKYPPLTLLAFVTSADASLPLVGSVNPKEINLSNSRQGPLILFFYSSSPNASITAMPKQLCTRKAIATLPSNLASSYVIDPASIWVSPLI